MKSVFAKLKTIDWPLLLLLTVVANQGIIWLKFAALLGVFVLRPQLGSLFKRGRLSPFIPLLLLVGAANFFLLVRDFSTPSIASFGVSAAFWSAAFLGAHQVRLSVEQAPQKVSPTLRLFVLLNVAISLTQLGHAAWVNGVWNPYKDLPFPYGMSTGDLLAGVFWEGGYHNAFVNTLLAVFFLFRREWFYAGLCLMLLLLIFGNALLISMVLVLMLIALFGLKNLLPTRLKPTNWRLFPSPKIAVVALACALSLVAMLAWVSPENVQYIADNITQKKKNGPAKAVIPSKGLRHQVGQLRFDRYLHNGACLPDTADFRHRLSITRLAVENLSGKKLSLLETVAYLQSGAGPLLMGAGPARFSSLTAARMSGLDSSRLFTRVLPPFATCLYQENHRLIHQVRISGDDAWLSTTNWPNSFYNQLLGEYGLVGLLLFAVFYVRRYARHMRRLSYGFWVSALMIPIALLTYLVEPLCVLFFYELIMEKDLADASKTVPA